MEALRVAPGAPGQPVAPGAHQASLSEWPFPNHLVLSHRPGLQLERRAWLREAVPSQRPTFGVIGCLRETPHVAFCSSIWLSCAAPFRFVDSYLARQHDFGLARCMKPITAAHRSTEVAWCTSELSQLWMNDLGLASPGCQCNLFVALQGPLLAQYATLDGHTFRPALFGA